MTEKPQVRVTSAILCDQVRLENNNKFFIIGVYSGEIVVAAFPTVLQLSAYFEISGLPVGEHPFGLQLEGPAGEAVVIEGGLLVSADHPAAVYTPPMPVPCPSTGEVVISINVAGNRFPEVIRKRVTQGDVAFTE